MILLYNIFWFGLGANGIGEIGVFESRKIISTFRLSIEYKIEHSQLLFHHRVAEISNVLLHLTIIAIIRQNTRDYVGRHARLATSESYVKDFGLCTSCE